LLQHPLRHSTNSMSHLRHVVLGPEAVDAAAADVQVRLECLLMRAH